jgi:hypothetical protein
MNFTNKRRPQPYKPCNNLKEAAPKASTEEEAAARRDPLTSKTNKI